MEIVAHPLQFRLDQHAAEAAFETVGRDELQRAIPAQRLVEVEVPVGAQRFDVVGVDLAELFLGPKSAQKQHVVAKRRRQLSGPGVLRIWTRHRILIFRRAPARIWREATAVCWASTGRRPARAKSAIV